MSPLTYYFIHILGVLVLTAFTFQAFAAPKPESRRTTMLVTGIASLVVLVAGFGLLAKLGSGFPGWVILKLIAWLGMSALAGFAYRKPGSCKGLTLIALVLLVIAVYAAYFKPF